MTGGSKPWVNLQFWVNYPLTLLPCWFSVIVLLSITGCSIGEPMPLSESLSLSAVRLSGRSTAYNI